MRPLSDGVATKLVGFYDLSVPNSLTRPRPCSAADSNLEGDTDWYQEQGYREPGITEFAAALPSSSPPPENVESLKDNGFIYAMVAVILYLCITWKTMTTVDQGMSVEEIERVIAERVANAIEAIAIYETKTNMAQLGSFDAIIGMDWLSKYQAVIVYAEKIVRIPVENKSLKPYLGDVERQPGKCEDTSRKEANLEGIPIVQDFPEVFPEDLPGLPPTRQVELQIDLVPGVAPVTRAPY
ncbi:putative reverse transcriptase domain-containing protein [Tanacetum coccineum]